MWENSTAGKGLAEDALWQRLGDFHVGGAFDQFTFEQRLARENGWTYTYAEQVVEEYKRFLYLIAHTRRQLTPSDAVDQVWHLHLAYTRSYWQELCQDILGFELHHHPTKGGDEQQANFKLCYADTLQSYAETFGKPAPETIWPGEEERFRSGNNFVRVNRTRVWMITKPRYAIALLGIVLLVPVAITACTSGEGESSFWFWVKVAIGIWGVFFLGGLINKHLGGGKRGGDGGGSGCGSGCESGCGGGD